MMKDMPQITLFDPLSSPEPVLEWLESKDPESIVGITHLSGQCPLSQFCLEVEGIHASVGNWFDMSTITVLEDAQKVSYATPEWARAYAESIDDEYDDAVYDANAADEADRKGESYAPPVSAGHALTLLKQVMARRARI
jgi:hypothetical protein